MFLSVSRTLVSKTPILFSFLISALVLSGCSQSLTGSSGSQTQSQDLPSEEVTLGFAPANFFVGFGSVEVDTIVTERIFITNESEATPVSILASLSNGEVDSFGAGAPFVRGSNGFQIISGGGSQVIAGGATHQIVVQYRPASVGTHSASIVVTASQGLSSPVSFSLRGSGTSGGDDGGTLSFVPEVSSTLQFQTIVNQPSVARDIIITNGTSSSVSISASIIDGATEFINLGFQPLIVQSSQFEIVSGGNQSIGAGGQEGTIAVRYNPSTVGNHSALLRITSNGGVNIASYNLAGAATNNEDDPIPVLTSIQVNPTSVSLNPSDTRQFEVLARYDGATSGGEPITDLSQVNFEFVTQTDNCSFNQSALLTAANPGDCSFTATYQNVPSNLVNVTVNQPAQVLTSILVNPTGPVVLDPTQTQQFTVRARYNGATSGGELLNDNDLAQVNFEFVTQTDNCSFNQSALLTAANPGDCSFTASYQNVPSNLVNVTVNQSGSVLQSISFLAPYDDPSIIARVLVNQTIQLEVQANYDTGSVPLNAGQVNWSVVQNNSAEHCSVNSEGLVTGLSVASVGEHCEVRAEYLSQQAVIRVAVSSIENPIVDIWVEGLKNRIIDVGTTTQFYVTGLDSEGVTHDITTLPELNWYYDRGGFQDCREESPNTSNWLGVRVTPPEVGNCVPRPTWGSLTSEINDTVNLRVEDLSSEITSIAFVEIQQTVEEGSSATFEVIATLNNDPNNTQIITNSPELTWFLTISNPACIHNPTENPETRGLWQGVSPTGQIPCLITARYGPQDSFVRATGNLVVTAAPSCQDTGACDPNAPSGAPLSCEDCCNGSRPTGVGSIYECIP